MMTRDVPPAQHHSFDRGEVEQVGGEDAEVTPRPVGVPGPQLGGGPLGRPPHLVAEVPQHPAEVVGVNQVETRRAHEFSGLDAEDVGDRGAHVGDDTFTVGDDDDVVTVLDDGLGPLFGAQQRRFGRDLAGDVTVDPDVAGPITGEHQVARLDREGRPVMAMQDDPLVCGLTPPHGVDDPLEDGGVGIGPDQPTGCGTDDVR